MQLEEDFAIQDAIFAMCDSVFEDFHALANRQEEALFFFFNDFSNTRIVEFRISFAHFRAKGIDQRVEEGRTSLQLVAVANSAATNTTQHIGAAFVARQNAVSNGESASADVVSDHLQRRGVDVSRRFAHRVNSLLSGSQEVLEEVDIVVVVHALKNGSNTFETHTRINAGLGQTVHYTAFVAVKLHEHEVPNFDVAVAIFVGTARRAALHISTVVIEDFRAWTARTRVAHHPEVVGHVASALVVTDANDAFCGNAHFFVPDVVGFVVFCVDGDPQFFSRKHEVLRQEFPGEVNGIVFEIIAKREVAEHFKESVVTCGVTHIVQVVMLAACANTFLTGGGTGVGALVETKEDVLELVHTSIGEEQGGIVTRNHRARANNRMSFAFEELQIGSTNICDFHSNCFFND